MKDRAFEKILNNNYRKLTINLFENVLKMIESPLPEKRKKKKRKWLEEKKKWLRKKRKWLEDLIKWCDKEEFWFSMLDEFCNIHPQRMKKCLKSNARIKLRELTKDEKDEKGEKKQGRKAPKI